MAWLHVDVDPRPGEELEAERERAWKKLTSFKPEPTLIIEAVWSIVALRCWTSSQPAPKAWRRDRPIAVINAQDVNSPEDLSKPGPSCLIKMSKVSAEALRQAFLDPTSRVRLNGDAQADPHAEFVALAWERGFLRDSAVHFNENLNVLVGGRGTNKSTMIESLRYVLGLIRSAMTQGEPIRACCVKY